MSKQSYVLLHGKYYDSTGKKYEKGDTATLTDAQAKAFGDRFEHVDVVKARAKAIEASANAQTGQDVLKANAEKAKAEAEAQAKAKADAEAKTGTKSNG